MLNVRAEIQKKRDKIAKEESSMTATERRVARSLPPQKSADLPKEVNLWLESVPKSKKS